MCRLEELHLTQTSLTSISFPDTPVGQVSPLFPALKMLRISSCPLSDVSSLVSNWPFYNTVCFRQVCIILVGLWGELKSQSYRCVCVRACVHACVCGVLVGI
jgi:hypothetical protein